MSRQWRRPAGEGGGFLAPFFCRGGQGVAPWRAGPSPLALVSRVAGPTVRLPARRGQELVLARRTGHIR